MRTSWADLAANSAAENATSGSSASNAVAGTAAAPTRSTYVPPHLRNRPPSADPPAPAYTGPPANDRGGFSGSRWGGPRNDNSRSGPGYGGNGGRGGGWGSRSGGWDGRVREVNPFGEEEETEQPFSEQENSGINFDAYEDIPVETSGDNVPTPVNTFADIDLGDALNKNIQRCKYVKPTPVQRHAIPISLAGRDLMACAQTGSGKTAAFCFPIISGIMTGQPAQRPPRGAHTVYPLALILSPTRELSIQVCFSNLSIVSSQFLAVHVIRIESFSSYFRFMRKLGNFHIKQVSGWLLPMEEHQLTNRFFHAFLYPCCLGFVLI